MLRPTAWPQPSPLLTTSAQGSSITLIRSDGAQYTDCRWHAAVRPASEDCSPLFPLLLEAAQGHDVGKETMTVIARAFFPGISNRVARSETWRHILTDLLKRRHEGGHFEKFSNQTILHQSGVCLQFMLVATFIPKRVLVLVPPTTTSPCHLLPTTTVRQLRLATIGMEMTTPRPFVTRRAPQSLTTEHLRMWKRLAPALSHCHSHSTRSWIAALEGLHGRTVSTILY